MTGQDRKEKFSRFLIKSVKSAKAFTFLSEKTVSNYVGSLNSKVLEYLRKNHPELTDVFEVSSFNEAYTYFNELRENEGFVENETNAWGNQYSNALFQYCCFLNACEVFNGIEFESNDYEDGVSFQQIFYGAPGTGKSHEVKRITGELEGGSKPNVFRTTFHPDTDYASFVGCYKPVMKPVPENLRVVAGREEDIAYDFVPQAFTDAYVYAYNNPKETTYLVIEEINRGNCAQIFGDLFQLLDRNENGTSDYSIKADKDLAKYLSDALDSEDGIKDGKLSLPANLRILATMNTSDQSLFPIDSAFKRRWDWEYVAIDYAEPKSSAFTITIGNTSFCWVDFIKVVNQRIYDVTQSEDKQMGNFFIKSSVNQKQFCSKVMFYLWNEVLKDEVENSKYFFYEDKGNNQTSKFTFTDVYGGNATSVLINFMKHLGVNPLQNQPAQNEEPQTDTDAQ